MYGKITIYFLALASISYITSEHALMWDIGWQFCFLSLFLMGYKLRQWGKGKESNRRACLLILSVLAIIAVLAFINYGRGLNGLIVDTTLFRKNPFLYAPLAPIEVIASCLTFAGFSVMKVKKNRCKLAEYTFLIYLIHPAVWNVIYTVLDDRMNGKWAIEAVAVIAFSFVVFFVSLILAIVYKRTTKIILMRYSD